MGPPIYPLPSYYREVNASLSVPTLSQCLGCLLKNHKTSSQPFLPIPFGKPTSKDLRAGTKDFRANSPTLGIQSNSPKQVIPIYFRPQSRWCLYTWIPRGKRTFWQRNSPNENGLGLACSDLLCVFKLHLGFSLQVTAAYNTQSRVSPPFCRLLPDYCTWRCLE